MELYMRDGKTPRCQRQVRDGGGWHLYQCSRSAVEDVWCRQHCESTAQRKKAEAEARYEADRQKRQVQHRRERLGTIAPTLLEALRKIAGAHGSLTALQLEALAQEALREVDEAFTLR